MGPLVYGVLFDPAFARICDDSRATGQFYDLCDGMFCSHAQQLLDFKSNFKARKFQFGFYFLVYAEHHEVVGKITATY